MLETVTKLIITDQTPLILGLVLAVMLTSLAVVHSNARARRHIARDETLRQLRLEQRRQQDRAAQIVPTQSVADPEPQTEFPELAGAS